MVQFIACYLAEWGVAETGIILLFVLLWQGLFILVIYFKFVKKITYLMSSSLVRNLVCNYARMLITLAIIKFNDFYRVGTLYELRRVSGCISIKEWVKCQLDGPNMMKIGGWIFESVEYRQTTYYNPSTGYPMHGGVDSAGNTFGSRWQDNNDR